MSKKKKRKQTKIVSDEDNQNLDIPYLLSSELYDTKPNMAKFLEKYVDSIRILFSQGKASVYPKYEYQIAKVIIQFKDNSFILSTESQEERKVIYERELEEIPLKEKHEELIKSFVQFLFQFKFVH